MCCNVWCMCIKRRHLLRIMYYNCFTVVIELLSHFVTYLVEVPVEEQWPIVPLIICQLVYAACSHTLVLFLHNIRYVTHGIVECMYAHSNLLSVMALATTDYSIFTLYGTTYTHTCTHTHTHTHMRTHIRARMHTQCWSN